MGLLGRAQCMVGYFLGGMQLAPFLFLALCSCYIILQSPNNGCTKHPQEDFGLFGSIKAQQSFLPVIILPVVAIGVEIVGNDIAVASLGFAVAAQTVSSHR